MLGGNANVGGSSEEKFFSQMSPMDQLKFEMELAKGRKYTPDEAASNIYETAYGFPITGNALAARDAMESKWAAEKLPKATRARQQLEADSAYNALMAALPVRFGSPASGSASRLGIFAPVKEGKTADRAKNVFDELADEIGPDAANKAVHDEMKLVFGAGGDLYDPVSDVPSRIKRAFEPGDVAPLSDVLEHPEMFAKVPYMRDLPVHFTDETTISGRDIARTLPEGGFKMTVAPDKALRERLTKLNQYEIANRENFPPAARHVEAQQLQELDDAIAQTRDLKAAGLLDDDAASAYLAQLTKQREDMDKILRGELEGVDLVTGTDRRWKNKDPKSATRNQLLHRSAGTIDATVAKTQLKQSKGGYPYTGYLPVNERLVMPRSPAVEQFSAMLKNWRKYGAGRGRSSK